MKFASVLFLILVKTLSKHRVQEDQPCLHTIYLGRESIHTGNYMCGLKCINVLSDLDAFLPFQSEYSFCHRKTGWYYFSFNGSDSVVTTPY